MNVGDDSTTFSTRFLRRRDGGETLLLRQTRLKVVEGPSRGVEYVITRPRVRVGSSSESELRLDDPSVSRHHLELRATEKGLALRDLGSTNGTFVGGIRIERALIVEPVTLRLGDSVIAVIPEEAIVEIPLSDRLQFGELLGRSTAMRELFALMERLAPTEASVLIEGESGTGKELVAEAIHHASRRKGGPLIVVDCGALPSSLIESELFGHVKGAFTGADHDREGVLEAASGGTVFLDEIGELPLALQPRLLRFLEHRQVRRVGSGETKVVDVRVIAATNRDLTRQRREGRFRDDLYYRLSVVRLEIPPLRDRPEDIKLLAMHMAQGLVRDPREIIDDATLALLRAHDWPGNVRELRNVVERLAYLPKSRAITGDERGRKEDAFEIPEDLFSLPFHDARTSIQKAFEARYLSRMLQLQGGVVARAASAAKLPRQTFHRLLKAHGLR